MNGISTRCAASSVSGMAISALEPKRSDLLACRITSTKSVVTTSSITNPVPFDDGLFAVEATSCLLVAISRTIDASTAPIS